jgi:hypothetical protein
VEKFKDFDEAIEADKKEDVQLKVAGKVYTLPATLPARTVLTQMRYASEGDQIPMNIVPEWIASLVGQDNYDQMLNDGMTWEQMNNVLSYLLEVYGLTAASDETVGETVDTEEDSENPK